MTRAAGSRRGSRTRRGSRHNRRETLETNAFSQGHGVPNAAVPAAAVEWAIPIDQLPPEGRELYEYDIAAARKLLTQAGLPAGFKVPPSRPRSTASSTR